MPRQFPQGESLGAAVSDGGRSCVYKITFLMSRETLPSASWRNSTSESEERISVGIFTSMPLAVWMLRLYIRRMREGVTVTGCSTCSMTSLFST